MSMQYCNNCGRNVDLDLDTEHFIVEDTETRLASRYIFTCNLADDSPGVEPGPRLTLDQKMARPYNVDEQGDFSGAGEFDAWEGR